MKRYNKHQLYPKSGAASFQQASGCCGAELLLRTPIINLGEGGVGGTFPPSFPFVPLLSPSPPPLCSSPKAAANPGSGGSAPAAGSEAGRGGEGRPGGGSPPRCGAAPGLPLSPAAHQSAHARREPYGPARRLKFGGDEAGELSSPGEGVKTGCGVPPLGAAFGVR